MSCEYSYHPKCSPLWGGKRYGKYIARSRIRAYKTTWSRKTGRRRILPRLKCRVTPTSIGRIPQSPIFRLKIYLMCRAGGCIDWRRVPIVRCKGGDRFAGNVVGYKVGIIKRRRYEQQWGLMDEVHHDCDE